MALIILLFLVLIIFSLILIKGADITVFALKRISHQLKAASFVMAAIVLALGTSFPELFVGLSSALQSAPSLSLGVVLGANITNLSLIAGVSGLSAGKVHIRGDYLHRDVWIALISGLAPIIFVTDGSISRSDGVVLLAIYVVYAASLFREGFLEVARGHKQKKDQFVYRFIRIIDNLGEAKISDIGKLALGLGMLLISANVIVLAAKEISVLLNLPVFVVGVVIIAMGTSLPEFAFSFRALREHSTGMFFGNILGSIIVNSTLIVGATSVIRPIRVRAVEEYYTAAATFVIVSLLFWYFARSKRRIDWWESLILLLIYIGFVFLEFVF